MESMHLETSVYEIPEWVTIKKVDTLKEYRIFKDICLQVFGRTFKRKLLLGLCRKELRKSSYMWWYKGECIGIYTLLDDERMRVTCNTNFRCLSNVAIVGNKQGQGFGRILLASAITNAAKLGCGELILHVAESNLRAKWLYLQMGFTFV